MEQAYSERERAERENRGANMPPGLLQLRKHVLSCLLDKVECDDSQLMAMRYCLTRIRPKTGCKAPITFIIAGYDDVRRPDNQRSIMQP